jgi:uncharacterized protein YgiM (DUF1202 family)
MFNRKDSQRLKPGGRMVCILLVLLLLGSGAAAWLLTPAPAQAAPLAAAQGSQGCRAYHVVQWGETLFGIAQRYGTSWPVLAQANNISNPDRIYAGQRLCIPYEGGMGMAVVANCYYLNMRSGPGVNFTVVHILSRGTHVQVLGQSAGWVQVRAPVGVVGWVNGHYLAH